ncbi:MAG: DNA repair protein RecN [Clostridia bacterium]|nr:DNA repair protein RecN [Clostridia bacterium]
MLTQLYIDNVAIIEHAELSLSNGLTVLTGETGAGKSILIDALTAVLGERASRDLVRTGCTHATVTAVFDDLPASVKTMLQEQGYATEDDGTLMLRRRISAENKSLSYIGSQPCTAATLRLVGRQLINIHGQHENQSLLSVERHVEYLDRLGGLEEIHARYEACYRTYCATHRELRKLTTKEQEKEQRLDMLRFQTQEIDAAALTEGEEDTLLARREVLHNAEKIARLLRMTQQITDGNEDETGALSALEQAASLLREAGRFLPEAADLSARLLSALPELQDIAATAAALSDSPDFEEAELDAVEDRLALVKRLCEKYGGSTAAVLAFAADAHAELDQIEAAGEEIARLTVRLSEEEAALVQAAAALTAARKQAGEVFASAVCEQLAFLDMPRVTLSVSVEPAAMTATGADKVEFLLSANPGEPPKSIAKIASGGELSRIMLALKSVMASADDIPTLIFDEIDSGISGRAAAKVGHRLRLLGTDGGKQVLCVTHLAQIAACASHHLLIEKQVEGERTFTRVYPLEEDERCEELARIIGGDVTMSALQTAREMLQRQDFC